MKKLLVFITLCFVFTMFTFGGIEWTTEMKTIGKGKQAPNNDISMHTYAQGGDVKQVFEGVTNENNLYFQNGYWLFKGDSRDIYIVNDQKKSYTVLNMDDLLQMTQVMGQMVKITILDKSINIEELPQQSVLGHTCNHLKITTEYTMKIKITFIKKTIKVLEVKEVWGSTSVPGIEEIGKPFLNKDIKTGIADLDELIYEQMKQQKKIGFPLKTITDRTEMSKKGKVTNQYTTTMEVKEIKSKKLSKDFFEVPAGYDQEETAGGKGLKGIFGK